MRSPTIVPQDEEITEILTPPERWAEDAEAWSEPAEPDVWPELVMSVSFLLGASAVFAGLMLMLLMLGVALGELMVWALG